MSQKKYFLCDILRLSASQQQFGESQLCTDNVTFLNRLAVIAPVLHTPNPVSGKTDQIINQALSDGIPTSKNPITEPLTTSHHLFLYQSTLREAAIATARTTKSPMLPMSSA